MKGEEKGFDGTIPSLKEDTPASHSELRLPLDPYSLNNILFGGSEVAQQVKTLVTKA